MMVANNIPKAERSNGQTKGIKNKEASIKKIKPNNGMAAYKPKN